MLIRLKPDQVATHWENIKKYIQKSLPPTISNVEISLRHIQIAIFSDHMDCWVMEEDGKFMGLALTIIVKDLPSGIRNLQIYSLSGLFNAKRETWVESFNTLREYAKAAGCANLISYSANETLIEIMKKFGAEAEYTFIAFPV